LDAVDQISEDRLRSWNTYHKNLGSAVAQFGITLPDLPGDDVTLNGHIFHILLEQAGQRPLFLEAMRKRGVHCTFHYAPLHASPAGRRFGSAPEGCPVTEDCAARLVRLPLYFQMGQSAIDEVVDATFKTLREMTT
jgi:dTDP-4-amino-4,6-dideoxygalactose transaminase